MKIMKSVSQISDVINTLLNKLEAMKRNSNNDNIIKQICEEIAIEYNNRGHLHYKSVEFDLAVSDYTKAIEFDENIAVAFYNRGTIHYRMSRFDKAVSDMKIATTLDPNNHEFETAFRESFNQLRLWNKNE